MVEHEQDVSIEACVRTLRDRLRRAAEEAEARAGRLRERAVIAARLLAERHGATRVWMFGSLAWGEPHAASDVDLLAEGIRAEDWLQAMKTAEEVVDAPVDVVRAEDAPAGLIRRVAFEGRLIHDGR